MPAARWADGPFPLIETPSKTMPLERHIAVRLASEMAHAHNFLIRGMNSIYLQAPYITKPKDIADLLRFTELWCMMLHDHHKLEEDVMFHDFEQVIEKPGFLEGALEQHHVFEAGVQELEDYAKMTKPANYDSGKLVGIIDSFAPSLMSHLNYEVGKLLTLEQEPKADRERLEAAMKKSEDIAVKKINPWNLPMVFGMCDRTYEGGIHYFPPIPVAVGYVAHWVMGWRSTGVWRFCPSDAWRNPRPLMFLPENQPGAKA